MGFEKIKLTHDQVEEFYSSHLVIADKATANAPAHEEEKKELAVKGKNKKHFVWVVNEPGYPFLDDADFQFTGDVITACKMNMEDIALVNLANSTISYEELSKQLQPKFLIISVQDLEWLPFPSTHYELHQVNSTQVYTTEPPAELRNDKVKKSKLWLSLKQMLGL